MNLNNSLVMKSLMNTMKSINLTNNLNKQELMKKRLVKNSCK